MGSCNLNDEGMAGDQLVVAFGTFYNKALECTVYKVDWYTKYIRVRKGTKRWYSSGSSLKDPSRHKHRLARANAVALFRPRGFSPAGTVICNPQPLSSKFNVLQQHATLLFAFCFRPTRSCLLCLILSAHNLPRSRH